MAELGFHPATPTSLSAGSFGSIMVRCMGPFLPAGPGTLTELHFYVNVGSGRKFRLGVYRTSNSTNQPLALIYSSAELTSTGDGYWHDLTGLSVALAGGPIWLSIYNADADLGHRYTAPGGTASWFENMGSYTSAGAWPDPITSLNSSVNRPAMYGVYTLSSTEIGYHPGSTEVTGASTGANGVPLLSVAGPFTPASAGTLTELHMYSAVGGGTRRVRLVVYANSGSVPGTLLYAGPEQTPPDPGWVDLTGLSVALDGSPVWIGAFSNDGTFAVKYVATTPNEFYSVANTYNSVSSPPSPFPAGTASAILFDIYGVYGSGTTYTKTGAVAASAASVASRASDHVRAAAAATGSVAAAARAGVQARAAAAAAGSLAYGSAAGLGRRDGTVTASSSATAARAVIHTRSGAAAASATATTSRDAFRTRTGTTTASARVMGATVPNDPATIGQILAAGTGTLGQSHAGHLDLEGSVA